MNKRASKKQNSGPNKTVRLNKYLSECGVASRRKADEIIKAGKVKVNKILVTELGTKVSDEDIVEYCGKKVEKQKHIYIIMNKPKDYLTTTQDPDNRKKVLDLLGKANLPNVFPIGRLDRNTSGLLILTNDGDLANHLMHPSRKIEKMYKVTLDRAFPKKSMETLVKGVKVENDFIKPDNAIYQNPNQKNKLIITIHSGQYHIVRRMFKSLGYHVKNLDRIYYGGVKKEKLKPGEWRHLTRKELNILKNKAGLKN